MVDFRGKKFPSHEAKSFYPYNDFPSTLFTKQHKIKKLFSGEMILLLIKHILNKNTIIHKWNGTLIRKVKEPIEWEKIEKECCLREIGNHDQCNLQALLLFGGYICHRIKIVVDAHKSFVDFSASRYHVRLRAYFFSSKIWVSEWMGEVGWDW